MDIPLLIRQKALAQALANLRAYGVAPSAAVVALYTRYADGELEYEHVQHVMAARARAISTSRRKPESQLPECLPFKAA